MADRVEVMYGGRVFESGTADEIFYLSRNPYTMGLLQSVPRLDSAKGDRLVPIPGSPPNVLSLPPGCAFAPRCTYATDICQVEAAELSTFGVADHRSRCHNLDQLGGAPITSTPEIS